MAMSVNRPDPRRVTLTSLPREAPLTSIVSTPRWIRATSSCCWRICASSPSMSAVISAFPVGRWGWPQPEAGHELLELAGDGEGLLRRRGARELDEQGVAAGDVDADAQVHLRLDQVELGAVAPGQPQPDHLGHAGWPAGPDRGAVEHDQVRHPGGQPGGR